MILHQRGVFHKGVDEDEKGGNLNEKKRGEI